MVFVMIPGNVLLRKGEANLPGPSPARVTHIMVIDKTRLIEKNHQPFGKGILRGMEFGELFILDLKELF